jgi:hypothetical protein
MKKGAPDQFTFHKYGEPLRSDNDGVAVASGATVGVTERRELVEETMLRHLSMHLEASRISVGR